MTQRWATLTRNTLWRNTEYNERFDIRYKYRLYSSLAGLSGRDAMKLVLVIALRLLFARCLF